MRNLLIATVLLYLAGCEGTCSPGRLAALEKENTELVQSFEKATRIIDEVQQNLARIEEREGIIDRLSLEAEQGTSSQDIEAQIQTSLSAIDTYLDENRNKLDELTAQVESSGTEVQGLKRLVTNLRRDVNKKEEQITSLKTQNRQLATAVANLETEVTKQTEVIQTQDQKIQVQDSTIVQQEAELDEKARAIEAQEEAARTAFFIVDSKDGLKQKGIVTESGGFLGIGKDLKIANLNEALFSPIAKSQEWIQLGNDVKDIEIVSPHKAFKDLYAVEKFDNAVAIHLTNPAQFWSISEYLVIRTK